MNRYFIITLFALLFSFEVNAQKEDAVYNLISKQYVLNQDGSQKLSVTKDLTVYSYPSIDAYGESFVVYNPRYQTLTIDKSYTRMKDGTIVETPENAFVPALPSSAADAPAYNHLLEMAIVHTALEPGCTIHLEYTIEDNHYYSLGLDIFETVKEMIPVKDYRLSVTIPGESELNYSVLNGSYKAAVTIAKDGSKKYAWNIKNVPALSRESGLSIPSGAVQVITANTYNDKNLSGGIGVIGDVITSVRPDAFPTFESVQQARDYISESYKLIPLSFRDAGLRIRNMEDVMNSGYGTEAELTFLLDCILDKMEVKGEKVVMAFPAREYDESLGLGAISGFFIVTDEPGEEFFSVKMNDAQTALFPRDYFTFLSFDNGKEVSVHAEDTRIDKQADLDIDVANLPAAGAGYRIFTIPDTRAGIAGYGLPMYSTRTENILLPSLTDEHFKYSIKYTGGTPAVSPKSVKLENKMGKVEISYTLQEGVVTVERSIKLNQQLVTPKLYGDLKSLLLMWTDTANTSVLFR